MNMKIQKLVRIEGVIFNALRFADDIVFSTEKEDLHNILYSNKRNTVEQKTNKNHGM